ncbi:hypothetical protein BBJ28_00010779 [Nothophytophthora sp. Chile5]|nr:hypothetical protein BBJ28_00010779 [Nothophytophthora sp. Chile5]
MNLRVQPQATPSGKRSMLSGVFSREKKYLVRNSHSTKKRITKGQLFNLARRLMVIAAAIQYIYTSMLASWRTMDVLRGTRSATETFEIFEASLIGGYVGDGLIRDSPLVQHTLEGDTTPRNQTLFLESATQTSFSNCSNVPLFDASLYDNAFLRGNYLNLVDQVAYNLTFLEDLELVVLVVDCSFTPLVKGDPSAIRVFNLVRSRSDSMKLTLVTVSVSIQDYQVHEFNKEGPTLMATLTLVEDVRSDSVEQYYAAAPTYPYVRTPEFEVFQHVGITTDSYQILNSIPRNPLVESVKRLLTARERGFYDGEDQSNIRYMYSMVDGVSASHALSMWEWQGEPVILDSWAWVHAIHFVFGMQTIFSLAVLFLVMYHNLRAGKIWIGDPFASVSNTALVLRGLLVALSWYVNAFWTLNEFCVSNASILSGTQVVRIHPELVHADVIVMYLCLVGVISYVFRERIDPSVAVFLFEIIHKHRLTMVRTSPAVLSEVVGYTNKQYFMGIVDVAPVVATLSPLRLWTAFQLPAKDGTFIAASFFPKIILLALIGCFAIMRKLYRHYFPDLSLQNSGRSADRSTNERAALSQKGNLTNFEIATGAELQTRFGIISDYKNYVYFKGMKFASADGIYCSGYVIANGKFLVAVDDLLAVVMIKSLGARLKNVYIYDVDGNTVKNTARLVYPETFTWYDILHLNVTVLL